MRNDTPRTVVGELTLCFPYEPEKREALQALIDELGLTTVQACVFINDIYYALQTQHGQYYSLAELNETAQRYFEKHKRRQAQLAPLGGAAPVKTNVLPFVPAVPIVPRCHAMEEPFPIPFECMKKIKLFFEGNELQQMTKLIKNTQGSVKLKLNIIVNTGYHIADLKKACMAYDVIEVFNAQQQKITGESWQKHV